VEVERKRVENIRREYRRRGKPRGRRRKTKEFR
jgi:hypothetical protein